MIRTMIRTLYFDSKHDPNTKMIRTNDSKSYDSNNWFPASRNPCEFLVSFYYRKHSCELLMQETFVSFKCKKNILWASNEGKRYREFQMQGNPLANFYYRKPSGKFLVSFYYRKPSCELLMQETFLWASNAGKSYRHLLMQENTIVSFKRREIVLWASTTGNPLVRF